MLHSKNCDSGGDEVSVLDEALALRWEGGISFSKISSTGLDVGSEGSDGVGGSRGDSSSV